MAKPVSIFIEGQEFATWTEMTLSRSKSDLTGSLSMSIFMGYMPEEPVIVDAAHGREIAVYIGDHLAFLGQVDRRIGTGARHGKTGTSENKGTHGSSSKTNGGGGGEGPTVTIGPNEYTVQLKARGKTKLLVDSSHQHPTTNMLKPKTRHVVEKLVEPWGIEVDWNATDIELDKVRFRDGARVIDELSRVCRENCYFMWETRDAKLYVTDAVGRTEGEPLVLGTNILQFSAEQGEDTSKKKIKVKGQRSKKGVRGEDAILNTIKEGEEEDLESNIPTTVQHYGDATPEALERRARFEANKRSSASKKVTIEVFHVQSTSGEPWDVGQIHYLEIPPEGIFDEFECTEISYSVKNNDELKTTLTLSPPPSKATKGDGKPTSNLPEMKSDSSNKGSSRKAAKKVSDGKYPAVWKGPVQSFGELIGAPVKAVPVPLEIATKRKMPLRLRNK